MSPEEYGRAVLGVEPRRVEPPLVRAVRAWWNGQEPRGTQRDYALAGRRTP